MIRFHVISLLVLLSLLQISCSTDSISKRGEIIAFSFERVENIEKGSWIKIDTLNFVHSSHNKSTKNHYVLPASKWKVGELEEPITIDGRIVANSIIKYLSAINKKIDGNLETGYTVIDPHMLDIKGVLKIAKTDSTVITVQVPKNYPVEISTGKYQ